MLKKRTIFFFIFLANIILLAHSVIPHHHHDDNMVCVEKEPCADNANPHEHNSDPHKDHNGNTDSQSCVLFQSVILNNQTKKDFDCLNCKPDIPVLHYSILSSIFKENSLKTQDFSCLPVLKSKYSVFISQCDGLRAPPVV